MLHQFIIHKFHFSKSGALVKILGLDDNSLKEQQYYPYEMIHWRN
ncbi:PoNe immunity protein domain-containing protein [Sphingobacterium sp.]